MSVYHAGLGLNKSRFVVLFPSAKSWVIMNCKCGSRERDNVAGGYIEGAWATCTCDSLLRSGMLMYVSSLMVWWVRGYLFHDEHLRSHGHLMSHSQVFLTGKKPRGACQKETGYLEKQTGLYWKPLRIWAVILRCGLASHSERCLAWHRHFEHHWSSTYFTWTCLALDFSQKGQPDGLSVSCGIGRLRNPKRLCAFVALGGVGAAASERMTCRIRGPSETSPTWRTLKFSWGHTLHCDKLGFSLPDLGFWFFFPCYID